jgi:hypothetical protein
MGGGVFHNDAQPKLAKQISVKTKRKYTDNPAFSVHIQMFTMTLDTPELLFSVFLSLEARCS